MVRIMLIKVASSFCMHIKYCLVLFIVTTFGGCKPDKHNTGYLLLLALDYDFFMSGPAKIDINSYKTLELIVF